MGLYLDNALEESAVRCHVSERKHSTFSKDASKAVVAKLLRVPSNKRAGVQEPCLPKAEVVSQKEAVHQAMFVTFGCTTNATDSEFDTAGFCLCACRLVDSLVAISVTGRAVSSLGKSQFPLFRMLGSTNLSRNLVENDCFPTCTYLGGSQPSGSLAF